MSRPVHLYNTAVDARPGVRSPGPGGWEGMDNQSPEMEKLSYELRDLMRAIGDCGDEYR